MKNRIRSALVDFFSGILAFVIALVVFEISASLLPFTIVATCLIFIVSFYRGKMSTLKPWLSFLLINLAFIALIVFQTLEVNVTILLESLPSLILSMLGLHLARNWNKISTLRRNILTVVPLVSVCLFFVFTISTITKSMLTREYHEPSPSFEFTMFDGDTVNSQVLRDKVVILNFWATWCGPCLLELPELEEVYDKYKKNPEIAFLVVNAELGGDTLEKAKEFVESKGFNLPFAYDFESKAYNSFNLSGTPGLVILDKSGQIRVKHIGYLKSEDFVRNLTQYIESFLNEGTRQR